MSQTLIARAEIALASPEATLDQMCDHLTSHGAMHRREGCRHHLCFSFGTARLDQTRDGVDAQVEGTDLAALQQLRAIIAGHLREFSSDPLSIRWTGDGSELRHPVNFRMLTVQSCDDLTPRMRRIRFAGADLAMFAGLDHIHVRLLFPQEAADPAWPMLGEDGLEHWPPEAVRPFDRRYTIRRIDTKAGWLEIDFVLHDDAAGPGSDFAQSAGPGDRIGMIGPGGGGLPLDRDWYLIAGDLTALPAIARFLEVLPAEACGHVLLQRDDPSDELLLPAPAGMQILWVGSADALLDHATSLKPPTTADAPFVWVGCEDRAFRALRKFARDDLGLRKGQHHIVSYWRAGDAEG